MSDSIDVARRAAEWAGRRLGSDQESLLEHYADWLVAEAIPAGGLGPREGQRIWARHIADSLTFGTAWSDTEPEEILDVGSGVGLPGIPLAVLFPDARVTLLDRGGRRVRLLLRAVRLLALPNVAVAQGDVFSVADEWQGIAFRGAVRAPEAVGLTARLLAPGGRAVLGLSRRPEQPERAQDLVAISEGLGLATKVLQVPEAVLDGAAWLLIMRVGA